MTDAGTAPDDGSSLPVRRRLHTDAEALRSRLPEPFRQTAQHRGTGKFKLCRPGRVVDRDDELAAAHEPRMNLAGDLGTDDLLPATGNTTEDEGILHSPLTQQLIKSSPYGHRRGRVRLLVPRLGGDRFVMGRC